MRLIAAKLVHALFYGSGMVAIHMVASGCFFDLISIELHQSQVTCLIVVEVNRIALTLIKSCSS